MEESGENEEWKKKEEWGERDKEEEEYKRNKKTKKGRERKIKGLNPKKKDTTRETRWTFFWFAAREINKPGKVRNNVEDVVCIGEVDAIWCPSYEYNNLNNKLILF